MQGKTTRGPKRGSNPSNRGREPKRKKIPTPRNTFSSRRKEDYSFDVGRGPCCLPALLIIYNCQNHEVVERQGRAGVTRGSRAEARPVLHAARVGTP